MIPEEMIGKKYNMLEVIALDTERTALKSRKYLVCKCDCGKQKSIRADAIGKIQSCGCIQRQVMSQYCKDHFKQYNRYGLEREEYGIGYTNKGEKFIFDKEDYEKISKYCWHVASNGYLTAQFDNKQYLMHRIIMSDYIHTSSDVIDHIQHNLLDNRKKYLRVVTSAENCMNKSKLSNNTSGVPDLSWSKDRNKWEAYIGVNGQMIHLGRYSKYEDAIRARQQSEEIYFGEYSYNNSINYIPLAEVGEADDNT